MKANDIVCADTQKTRIELDLDIMYSDIMKGVEYILTMCGLDKNFIDNKLDNWELLQSELDNALMELIEIIKYKESEMI